MQNRLSLTFAFVFLKTFAFAQTKLIHHKSHSGSSENFLFALENNLFDIGNSNFGAAPVRIVRTAALDSLIYLSDTSAIMVTKEVCRDEYAPKERPGIWQAGRDTVYHHPLFTLKYELDSIKKTLKQQYNFQNPVKEMVFIGYGNREDEKILNQNQESQLSDKKLKKQSKKVLKKLNKQRNQAIRELNKANKNLEKAKIKAEKANKNLNQATKDVEKIKQKFYQEKEEMQQEIKELKFLPEVITENPPPPSTFLMNLSIPILVGIIAIFSLLTGFICKKLNQVSQNHLVQ